jgi:hypothetical protein
MSRAEQTARSWSATRTEPPVPLSPLPSFLSPAMSDEKTDKRRSHRTSRDNPSEGSGTVTVE